MNKITGIVVTSILLTLVFVRTANAAIVLSNIDSDLHVVVQNPVTFDVITDYYTFSIAFMLPDAVDISGSGGFQLTSEPSTAPLMSGPDFSGITPSVGVMPGNDNLYIAYNVGSPNFSIGDQITLSAGELVLPNFFDFGVIQGLNYTYATEAVLTTTGYVPLSLPTSTAVPVPATIWLLGSALGTVGWLRRKQAAYPIKAKENDLQT
jgi:hypothetical protein